MSKLGTDRGGFQIETPEQLHRRVRRARALLRSIVVAIDAIDDGSVELKNMDVDAEAQRWAPLTNAAQQELIAVRETCIHSTVDLPMAGWDWVAPLAMVEALDAALWYGCARLDDTLKRDEIQDVAEAIVGVLDEFLEEEISPAMLPVRVQPSAVAAH